MAQERERAGGRDRQERDGEIGYIEREGYKDTHRDEKTETSQSQARRDRQSGRANKSVASGTQLPVDACCRGQLDLFVKQIIPLGETAVAL